MSVLKGDSPGIFLAQTVSLQWGMYQGEFSSKDKEHVG